MKVVSVKIVVKILYLISDFHQKKRKSETVNTAEPHPSEKKKNPPFLFLSSFAFFTLG